MADFVAILRLLTEHDVEFVVVGALSAVLQGAPIMTFDLDIVHHRSDDNISRLLEALDQLEAHFRGHPDKTLRPGADHLRSPGHQLLSTNAGPLDLLGEIENRLDFGTLIADAREIWIDDFAVPVLPIQKYVALKEESPREKDQARLPLLRRALLEREDDED